MGIMTKQEYLIEVCNKCPIKQVIKNCYNTACNVDKCWQRYEDKKKTLSQEEWNEEEKDRLENIKIINEMLDGMD